MIIFGAGKLPQVGSSLGKGLRNFKKGMNGRNGQLAYYFALADHATSDQQATCAEQAEEHEVDDVVHLHLLALALERIDGRLHARDAIGIGPCRRNGRRPAAPAETVR